MNNVDQISPIRVVHNMDVTTDKKLRRREGYALWHGLEGSHSLFFDGEVFFCAAKGSASPESLYKVTLNKEVTEIGPITGAAEQLYYIPLNGRMYISSKLWNGIYEDGVIRPWGYSYGDDPAALENASSSEEQITLNTIAAPCMENLALAGGRIFGSAGRKLWYNDPPLAYEMFRPDTFHEVDGEITMVAPEGKGGVFAREGLYIATSTATWFAEGYDPENWVFAAVGDGAIPGTFQYVSSLKLDNRSYNNVPVWLNRHGVQAGIGGVVQNVSKGKVRFEATGRAASFYREQAGGQYLSTFMQPPEVGFGDSITCEVVRAGKLIT